MESSVPTIKNRILVVDDALVNVETLLMGLQGDFDVVTATNGKTALEIANKDISVDLIVLDIMMPGMDGYEVCESLKKSEKTKEIPVLFMSALDDEAAILKGFEVGAADYLTKPFNLNEVIIRIRTQLGVVGQRKVLEEKLFHEQLIRKKQEKQMIQQEKMAAMGEMLALITHQWYQPLNMITSITTNIRFKGLLAEGPLDRDKIAKSLDAIEERVLFLSDTMTDFKNFFKSDKESHKVYLHDIVGKTLDIVGESFKHSNIAVDVSACKFQKQITVFSNELIQVILNILNNAVDALIETTNKERLIVISCEEDDYSQTILIEDNAGGIPENIMGDIFDADFTTKKNDKGTGLGLYMSKIIVEEHSRGKLQVKNVKNGACFAISIPFEMPHSD